MELSEIIGGAPVAAAQNDRSEQLGQEDFLRMLIAQLENQDPLDPQDATEFTAQLAQFTSLDQLISMRESIDRLSSASGISDGFAAAGLIGEGALVESQRVAIGSSEDPLPRLLLDLPASSQIRSVALLSPSGGSVAIADSVGQLDAGVHALDWAGFDRVPEPGIYSLRVTVQPGDPTPATLIHAEVTGATLTGSETAIQLGELEVPLSALREIGAGPKRDS